ncbi:acyltransferase [Clostridium magnum]|uniref:Putative poly-beta-1,6-N-acetyl-D-glucosamine export protein n=1 Tax=Clostridium magnum DSM 2767 TaxID=1121326 RepID=A0A162UBH2_9CLOT|nr:acyltransferase [Clostridium magnum]KZL93735.1 putative poly-beta-1,6-N-acetyl-D-glucosamine export protein [Clostridium magnum DSM 2767]SHI09605.1 Surface polysaccharide O-acyltransferase, integral membrane enzyme [Clostridium magnum DSM 2767]
MDVIRALAIVAVVVIHVSATILYRSDINSYIYKISIIINQLSRFSVPAFIFISGMGLTLSNKKELGYFAFIGRRFSRIVPQYILWCLIYIYLTTKNFEIYSVVYDVVYGKVFYHFYYVPLIIEFYLIYPFLYRFIGKKWAVITSFLLTFGILIYSHYFVMSDDMEWFLERKNLLDWIFYFSFGAFIGENLDRFLEKIRKYRRIIYVLFFLSIYIMLQEAFTSIRVGKDIEYATTFLRPTIFLYSILFILFVFCIQWKENIFMKWISYIAKNSYSIYLSHAIILYYFTQYYINNSFAINSLQFLVKAFIVSFISPIVINKAKNYL